MKCFCRLKSEYCSTTQNCLFKMLSLSAKHWWPKSTQRAKYDFSRELEEKLSEESRREREFFSKSRISRGEREFFPQNLDIREHLEKWKFNSPARDRKKWTISSRDFLEIENLVNAWQTTASTLDYTPCLCPCTIVHVSVHLGDLLLHHVHLHHLPVRHHPNNIHHLPN